MVAKSLVPKFLPRKVPVSWVFHGKCQKGWSKKFPLKQWFLKCRPWTSSNNITWEVVRNADSLAEPRPNESRNSVGGAQPCVFISSPSKFNVHPIKNVLLQLLMERDVLALQVSTSGGLETQSASQGPWHPCKTQFLRGFRESDERKMELPRIKFINWTNSKILNFHYAFA